MKTLLTIGITITTLLIVAFLLYNFLPLGWIEFNGLQTNRFGATITTILGTDTLSASRSVINTNFSNLNSYKIENTTTTLPLITTLLNLTSVGTIGTGLWRGTGIEVIYGGTGTTSPTSNLIILGNGAAGFKTIGFGTAGQLLTSAGLASAPYWSSPTIDTAINYNWTGFHTFINASSTGTLSLQATTQYGISAGLMPAGSITVYSSTTPPTGWFLADGSSKAVASYPDLFSVIGYIYGGAGANFNLPNLKGRNVIGYGSATTTIDTLGKTGGETQHVQTAAEMVAHTHSTGIGPSTGPGAGITYNESQNSGAALNTDSAGSSAAFNVLDPYIVLVYIIKY